MEPFTNLFSYLFEEINNNIQYNKLLKLESTKFMKNIKTILS